MKKEQIIRSWKDPAFRASLSAEERSALPDNPAGDPFVELDAADLLAVAGGQRQETRSPCSAAGECL